jgi:hypothetical protein
MELLGATARDAAQPWLYAYAEDSQWRNRDEFFEGRLDDRHSVAVGLDVVPRVVPNAVDGWPVADSAVVPFGVVVL